MGVSAARRWSWVTATVIALATCASAQAARSARLPDATSLLTITGTGTSYGTVQLLKPVNFPDREPEIAASAPQNLSAVVLVSLSAGDSAPGVAFVRLHNSSLRAAYQFFGVDNGNTLTGTPVYVSRRLPAGAYRIFLISHGPNRVTIRLPGEHAGRTLITATTRTTSVVTETTPPGIPGQAVVPQSTTVSAFTSVHRPLMLGLGWARATSVSGQAYACATPNPPANDPTADTPYCSSAGIVDFVDPELGQLSFFDAWYQPAAGNWQFKEVWNLQGLVADGGGWVLQLDLGVGYPSAPEA